jgi:hypothetical protein
MNESVQTVEELDEVLLEIIDVVEGEEGLLGKVLHPNGTRDFPNGGAVVVRNNTAQQGKYRYRVGANGQWVNRTIQPNNLQGYNAQTAFYLKNIGTVDLDVTP